MNAPIKSTISSSNRRKYSVIWQKLKNPPHRCEIITTHADSMTVINGVKKEKTKDRTKPKFRRLDISSEEIPNNEIGKPSTIKIIFKLVDEISINTI